MPRKPATKKENKIETFDWRNKKYDGFLEDVYSLVEWCHDSNLEKEIDEVLIELKAFHSNMPGRTPGQVEAKSHYGLMIGQLEELKNYFYLMENRMNSPTSVLSSLMNEKPFLGDRDKEASHGYWTNDLYDFVIKAGNKLFRDKDGTGSILNIKRNLDGFNACDEYTQYTTNNSVLVRVDNIFNRCMRLYAELSRISVLNNKYVVENNLEDVLGYEQQNLEEYGKRCMEDPDFNLSEGNKAYNDAKKASYVAEEQLAKDTEAQEEAQEEYKKLKPIKDKYDKISELYSNLRACDDEYIKIQAEPAPEGADADEYDRAKKEKLSSILGKKTQYRREIKNLVKGTDIPYDDEEAFHKLMDPQNEEYLRVQKDLLEKEDILDASLKKFNDCKSKENRIREVNANNDIFYTKYSDACRFDKFGSIKKSNKKVLDGEWAMTQYRAAFRDYARRKDHTKEADHSDTPEFTGMTDSLAAIIGFNTETGSIETYLGYLQTLKDSAQHYLDEKARQKFHWIPSKMRKYRLQYAKGLIELCNSQLNTIDPEDFKHTTVIASRFINAKMDLYNESQDEDADRLLEEMPKDEYYRHLDSKRKEAVEAYTNSKEYRAQTAKLEKDYQAKMESKDMVLKAFDDSENQQDKEFMVEQIKELKKQLTDEYTKAKEELRKKAENAKVRPDKNPIPKELRQHRRMNAFTEDPILAPAPDKIQDVKKKLLE